MLLSLVPMAPGACSAQDVQRAGVVPVQASASVPSDIAMLPDDPGFTRAPSSSAATFTFDQGAPVPPQVAKHFATTIQPGESAQPLSAGDKFAMGIRKQVTVGALASWLFSAGYGQLVNGRPHYGTDSGGFGERLGGAALKQTTQSIFNYGIYSNLFHEDPRYYVLGPTHHFKHRVVHAALNVVVTRKDNGGNTPNWALLSAIASSAALANAYYPGQDQSVKHSVTSAISTIGIRAGTQQLREFSGDIRRRLHLKH